MTSYATMAALLISFALNDVGPLVTAATRQPSKSLRGFPAKTYGVQAFGEESEQSAYSENSSEPNYYAGGGVSEDDYNTDDVDNGRERQEHEDQLDQDDPGNFSSSCTLSIIIWLYSMTNNQELSIK